MSPSHPDQSVGVLLPYTKQVTKFVNRLQGKTTSPVQMYMNGVQSVIDFAKPGIKLVTHSSAKGLEFDTVFLPELQSIQLNFEGDDHKMRMYVLTSRAKNRLDLMYSGEGVPPWVDALPTEYLDVR